MFFIILLQEVVVKRSAGVGWSLLHLLLLELLVDLDWPHWGGGLVGSLRCRRPDWLQGEAEPLDGSEEVGVLHGLVHLLGQGVTELLVLSEGDLQLGQFLGEDRLVAVEIPQAD